MRVHLLTLVGGHIDLLPLMLAHYRRCGIEVFSVNVHLCQASDPVIATVRRIVDAFGCDIASVSIGDWQAFELSRWLEVMRSHPDDWWVLADQDELHLYPDDLFSILRYCERKRYDFVRGVLVDRLSEDGTFSEVRTDRLPGDQFPLGSVLSTYLLGASATKVTIAKGHVVINTGHHLASSGVACPVAELLVQVDHFKWTAGVVERQRQRAERFRLKNLRQWEESARLVEYCDAHGGRIDVSDARFLMARCDPAYPHLKMVLPLHWARRRLPHLPA